jgi:hypothetical protein|tara:strand:+ start:23 stop:232 length:210 start_codon:yes stop_codon:yes gene_type:complete
MDFEEYKTNVSSRFDALVDEEREQVIEFLGSPIGEIMISVLGNELFDLGEPDVIEPTAPVRRGLAAPII